MNEEWCCGGGGGDVSYVECCLCYALCMGPTSLLLVYRLFACVRARVCACVRMRARQCACLALRARAASG